MRLHRLELRGIGPFGDTETIDFDRLSASGLFLMEGPTGAGKSTLIDAIVWALFGSVAGGSDSTVDRMRSLYANPREASYVDLVFSVNAGTYRVRREPRYFKAGNKNATAPRATLWRLSPAAVESGNLNDGEVLATQVRDVSTEVERLVGLNAEQFTQTVVLPQGKFAQFLGLNSQDRAALLTQIFNTGRFDKVAQWFEDRAKSAQQGVRAAQETFIRAVSNVGVALGKAGEWTDAASALALTEGGDSLLTEITEAVGSAETAANAAEEAAAIAEQQREARRADVTAAEALEQRLAQRAELIARHAELTAASASVAAQKAELERHRATLPLMPVLAAEVSAREAVEGAQDTVAQAREKLRDTDSVLPATGEESSADLRASEAELDRLRTLVGQLTELVNTEKQIAADTDTQHREQSALAGARVALTETTIAGAELPDHITAVEEELDATRVSAAGREAARTGVVAAEEQQRNLKKLAAAEATLTQATADRQDAFAAYQAAATALSDTTRRWAASMAADLAQQLEENTACPVCGSTSHPAPAMPTEEGATRQQVNAAKRRENEASEQLSAAGDAVAAAQAARAALAETLKGADAETVAAGLAGAKKREATAEAAEEHIPELEQRLAKLRAQREHLRSRAEELTAQIAGLEASTRDRAARIAAARERIASERGAYASVAERQAAVSERAGRQNEWNSALRTLLDARERLRQAQTATATALADSLFNSEAEVRAAHVSPERAAALEATVTDHDQQLHDVERDLARPDIAALTGDEDPHLEQKQAAFVAQTAAANAARNMATAHRKTATDARRQLRAAHEALDGWKRADRDQGPIARLASIAKAGDASLSRVPLTTYVLIERFNAVVEVANQQLQEISRGRYALERTEDKEEGSRQKRVGLGLAIADYSPEAATRVNPHQRTTPDGSTPERSTKSLSGGEKFYVSLALALGLVEVVRAENGGIGLDTLLIDEGFGSLDGNTLDLVMATLHGLGRGGRTVGVVSHVADMRNRISERITVVPREGGGSTLKITA